MPGTNEKGSLFVAGLCLNLSVIFATNIIITSLMDNAVHTPGDRMSDRTNSVNRLNYTPVRVGYRCKVLVNENCMENLHVKLK